MRAGGAVRALLGDRRRRARRAPGPSRRRGRRSARERARRCRRRARARRRRRSPASSRSNSEPVVTVELDPALLAVLGDVEARRQPHERPVLELDQRDAEVGRAHREGLARRGHAIGVDDLPVRRDAARRAEDGGEVGERVDADVRHRPDRVERRRPRVPGLDPAPVDLGVDDAHRPDRAGVEQAPRGLLGIAQEGDRRAGEPQPERVGELDERCAPRRSCRPSASRCGRACPRRAPPS